MIFAWLLPAPGHPAAPGCATKRAPPARPGLTVPAGRPADEWHGAAPGHFMTHLSITEAVPGDERPEADWGERVTDEEYNSL